MKKNLSVGLVLASVSLLAACQSAPSKQQVEQQIIPPGREAALARDLERRLEMAYRHWNDTKVAEYLDSMAAKLVASDPAYAQAIATAPKVFLLETSEAYAAPGLAPQIFLSRGMLSSVHYENELAFVIASQLALLRDRTTVRNLAALEGQEVGARLITLPTAPPARQVDYLEKDWFEPGGLFDFGLNPYLKADADAVRLIYAAKFDPRGAVTFIERWTQSPTARKAIGKILPEPQERLRTVRDEVAKLSPLRDPIVRTRAFDDLRSRLQKSK